MGRATLRVIGGAKPGVQSPLAGNKPSSSPTQPARSYGGVDPGTIPHEPFLQYGQQIMQMAADPQNALRNREQGRLQEQVRAGLEARGLNYSGAGQGIENEALSNFDIDWQNALLDRMISGASAYGSLGGIAQNIAQSGFSNAGALGESGYRAPTSSSSGTDMQMKNYLRQLTENARRQSSQMAKPTYGQPSPFFTTPRSPRTYGNVTVY